jgi:hypothetical protein
MNTKKFAIALIAGLSYEVLLKLCLTFAPSVLEHPALAAVSSILSFLVGVVLILFLLLFYKENRSNQKVAAVSLSLVACFALRFLLRLPALRSLVGYEPTRFVGEALGFATAILLFLLAWWYRSCIPGGGKSLRGAADVLAALLAVAVVPHIYSLIDYARFMSRGTTTDFPPAIYQVMFMLFVLTHASAMYFLYRYAQSGPTPQP